jgi:hypothetical protein
LIIIFWNLILSFGSHLVNNFTLNGAVFVVLTVEIL